MSRLREGDIRFALQVQKMCIYCFLCRACKLQHVGFLQKTILYKAMNNNSVLYMLRVHVS